ncbi:hypothetical protein TELCIR_10448 [Teladorsagia circumcincta]|uniref:Uncharacterized protein n=1 Tax=Teladorsagia circumcincta TaxID=45464 RepID=A0A2G9UCA1_TELCI|nr:hypothetical protein TELCIR_10448 [Teladorsagia circumcincta]
MRGLPNGITPHIPQFSILQILSSNFKVHRRHSTTASNTELHLLSVSELEDTVAAVVSQYLHHPAPPVQPERVSTAEPLRGTPDETRKAGKPLNGTLGKNLVPRLQKLRVLDRMIGERTALVERFDANFVKQEIARKRAFILKCRMAKENKIPPEKVEISPPKLPSKATREVATQAEKASASSESSTASETASESSEESEESEESDESTATSAEDETTSENSTSSSRETVLRRKSTTAPGEKSSPEKDEMAQETAEELPKALSPTSLYLKQLREKILKERMQKI